MGVELRCLLEGHPHGRAETLAHRLRPSIRMLMPE
jgi:hypothetical protein